MAGVLLEGGIREYVSYGAAGAAAEVSGPPMVEVDVDGRSRQNKSFPPKRL